MRNRPQNIYETGWSVSDSGIGKDLAYGADQQFGVEFRTDNLIGTVALKRDAMVADVGDPLIGYRLLDRVAEKLGVCYTIRSLDVDEDKVIGSRRKHLQGLGDTERGVNLVPGNAEDLVA